MKYMVIEYWPFLETANSPRLLQLAEGTALGEFFTTHYKLNDTAPETMQGLLIKLTGTPLIVMVETLHLPEITGQI